MPNHSFINIKLTEKDRPHLEEFANEYGGDLHVIASEILAHGYKLSVSWVDDRNSFIASISGTKNSRNNQGRTITSWSDDLVEAVFMSAYKHLIVCSGGDWQNHHVLDTWG